MKKIIFFCFLLASCSGKNLLTQSANNEATVFSKQLIVKLSHHGTIDENGNFPDYLQPDGAKEFVNNLGITIHLTEASLNLAHLHLGAGDDPAKCVGTTETSIDLDFNEDVIKNDNVATQLAIQNIMDQEYCQYTFHVDPSQESPDYSALLKGTWTHGAQSGDFEISMDDGFEISGDFTTSSGSHPLHYHAGQTSKTLLFEINYDKWFDDIDFTEDSTTLQSAVTDNIQTNLTEITQ